MQLSLSLAAVAAFSLFLTAAMHSAAAQPDSSCTSDIQATAAAENDAAEVAFLAGSTCDDTIVLAVSSAGRAINADGNARIRTDARNRESFRVEMDADVHNGTVFTVTADGVQAGTIKMKAHRGVLEVDNEHGRSLPTGLDPVCAIKQVVVTDSRGNTVLDGSF